MYDVIIIGAGVCGSAIARELSAWNLKIAVMDRNSDVCEGTSKANSGIVHSGYDAKPGSLKAKMNLKGNQMMEALSKELDFPFQRIGSLTLAFDVNGRGELERLLQQGQENGVEGLRILDQMELQQREPEISPNAIAALYAPTAGVVCPFMLTIALAENAIANGVDFFLENQVYAVRKERNAYALDTEKGLFQAKVVVNAAGVYADFFHNMVSKKPITIIPRKGEYCLFDKKAGMLVHHTIFQLPTQYGKGVLVTPTVHGNLMIGPTANDIEDKDNLETTTEGLTETIQKATLSVENLPMKQIITSFAGLRAHEVQGDFIIGEVEDAQGFFDVAGIESPGLTCSPAIGQYVAKLIVSKLNPSKSEHFYSHREGILRTIEVIEEQRTSLIEKNPSYGTVICRCESVSEAEIVEAIKRCPGPVTLDAIKRRTRAGMGRCQSGFCMPKVMDIISKETHIPKEKITKKGRDTYILEGIPKKKIPIVNLEQIHLEEEL